MELQKANLESQKAEGGSPNGASGGSGPNSSSGNSNHASGLANALPPLAKLLTNPLLSQLSSLGNLGGFSDLLSNLPGSQVQTTGAHRRHNSSFTPKIKHSGSPPPKSKSERSKFAPY